MKSKALRMLTCGLLAVVSVASAAAEESAAPVAGLSSGLAPTFATMEEMARAALAAVAVEDITRLRQLAVTEDEFYRVVWPELDVARPEGRMPPEFVWRQHEMRHERGLQRAIALFGGRELRLRGITISDGTRDYGSYRIHRASQLDVQDADGSTTSIELFASVIEVAGRFKIYSFITD